MRDLASIVSVASVNKMFEKDRIVWISLNENGYEFIVPADTKVGDKLVCIQEGAILPVEERWEFLRKRCYRDDLQGFLIKPMTMGAKDLNGEKGDRVKSWGLCVTLSEAGLPENLKPETDVTDKLNIRKYEPAEDASPKKMPKIPRIIKFCLKHKLTRWIGNRYMAYRRAKYQKGDFPTEIISKSDETTIQNCKAIMRDFPGKQAFITVKMEGCSATYGLDPKTKKFYVCSRNNRYDSNCEAAKNYFTFAEQNKLPEKLQKFYKKYKKLIIIQGELCGNIQNNIYNFNNFRFFVYRMKLFENNRWVEYNYEDMTKIIDELDLERVPLIEVIPDMGKFKSINDLVEYAEKQFWIPSNLKYKPKNNEKLFKDYLMHEGIVVKSIDYNKELNIGFSFKVKNLPYQEHQLSELHNIAEKLLKNNK